MPWVCLGLNGCMGGFCRAGVSERTGGDDGRTSFFSRLAFPVYASSLVSVPFYPFRGVCAHLVPMIPRSLLNRPPLPFEFIHGSVDHLVGLDGFLVPFPKLGVCCIDQTC